MKKWLALVVAALLALSTMAAFADVTPSKTTEVKIDAEKIETSTGTAVGDDFIVATPEEVPEKTEEVVKELFDLTSKDDTPVVTYFSEDTQKTIAELLPEGTDLTSLEMSEIIALVIENYDESYGDIAIVFHFETTAYDPDQSLVAMLGIYSAAEAANVEAEDGVEWFALAAEAVDNGDVKVTFTQDVLVKAEAADSCTLGILNTPLAK